MCHMTHAYCDRDRVGPELPPLPYRGLRPQPKRNSTPISAGGKPTDNFWREVARFSGIRDNLSPGMSDGFEARDQETGNVKSQVAQGEGPPNRGNPREWPTLRCDLAIGPRRP